MVLFKKDGILWTTFTYSRTNTKLYVNLKADGINKYVKFLHEILPDKKKSVVNQLIKIKMTVEDEFSKKYV